MEPIKLAVDRARRGRSGPAEPPESMARPRVASAESIARRTQSVDDYNGSGFQIRETELNAGHLEAHRIISHNVADPRSKSFDILRTQILQIMDQKRWRCIGVTSPTQGCGKTVMAFNLAFSIARQEGRSVLLVDLDLQRPQVANYLGIACQRGMVGVLEGRTTPREAIISAYLGDYQCAVLPAEAPTLHSSELIASRNTRTILEDIKAQSGSRIAVLDLPPTLSGDEVISIAPLIDCVLLVAAVGRSTQHEVKECMRLLQSTEIARIVLNKSSEATVDQYY